MRCNSLVYKLVSRLSFLHMRPESHRLPKRLGIEAQQNIFRVMPDKRASYKT